MVTNSAKVLLIGVLAVAGAAGLRAYRARRRHRGTDEFASAASDRALSRPGYAESGRRQLVNEPPDELDESLPLGLA